MPTNQPHSQADQPVARKAWTSPAITEMPPLRDLTLQTGFASTQGGSDGFTLG